MVIVGAVHLLFRGVTSEGELSVAERQVDVYEATQHIRGVEKIREFSGCYVFECYA